MHKGNIDAFNVLLRAGADPSVTDDDGDACLHHAVLGGSKEVLERVISLCADVNVTGKFNQTALMKACSAQGNIDAFNVLLRAGADPSVTDDDGDACLHHAVLGGSKEVLERVISLCADVNVTGKFNQTALMLACNEGKYRCL